MQADKYQIDFTKGENGLVPAIAQDWTSREILMIAYMNEEAFVKTASERVAYYFSRSKQRIWKKGESSGHIQIVKEILIDCDQDAIVLLVEQVGKAACHTGYNSCFYRRLNNSGELEIIKNEKVFDPETVYKNTSKDF